ncbi:MAG: zinc ribbon domain-containing protein [Bacteroidota bacterium]
MSTPPVCPSCGAIGRPGSERCELCGTAFTDSAELDGILCPSCSHVNPAGAAFCNQCGATLALVEPPPAEAPPVSERASSAPGRRALALIGTGLAVVVGLYAITLWSESRTPESTVEATAPLPEATPIPDGTPPLPEANQAQVDALEGANTAEGWYEAGRFYLTAAFEVREINPTQSAQWARRAIADFERSLALQEDADVRLALAEALRFDPSTPPMRPIEEVQRILDAEPDHAAATFLLADLRLMRASFQPEWADSARVSFERVIELTQPGDSLRARAQRALAQVPAPSAG